MVAALLTELTVRRKGAQLLGPLSLELSAQGVTALMGPNGAGKSTLLRALHGMMRHAGTLAWEGTPRKSIVFQSPILLRRSVLQNLAYPLQLSGTPDAQAKAEHWADQIGLAHMLHHDALRLSGGEKQKLALARALITEPDVLLLDEPCAALDPTATREIESILRDAAQAGTRLIMATHDLGQARRLATDVVLLHRGRVLETGAAPQIFAAPRTRAAAAFFAGEIVE